MLQTVQKIGPVLDLFTAQRPEWGVSEVAAALGLPRSSVHAVLTSLVDTGLLQTRFRGRYRLGWRVVELNQTMRSSVDVRSLALPILQKLVKDHRETAHLAVMENGKVLYLDKVIGTHNLIVRGAHIGTQRDAHSSGVGKILLAGESWTERHPALNQPLRRFTASTIVDPRQLGAELDKVRKFGVAYDEGETAPEVRCVAAPVKDELGSVIAAVSITVPVTRFPQRLSELTAAVKAAAKEVSQKVAANASDGWDLDCEDGWPIDGEMDRGRSRPGPVSGLSAERSLSELPETSGDSGYLCGLLAACGAGGLFPSRRRPGVPLRCGTCSPLSRQCG
jgi:DNA-binding IclR family transcriptional regulator